VAAIAKRSLTGMLAATEINGSVFISGIRRWFELGSFVCPVAERLLFAQAAGTPVIGFSSFNRRFEWCFLCNVWFAHKFILFVIVASIILHQFIPLMETFFEGE